jgi:hypothetical protein
MRQALRKWWEGSYVSYENNAASPVVFIGGDYERHWTAKVVRAVVAFYLKNWQWCWGAAFALTGLIIAAKKL